MKYLVLRKRRDGGDNPFTEMVSAGGGAALELPFEARAHELDERDAGALRKETDVEDVIPSIMFTLVAPVPAADVAPNPPAWGLDAIGAANCEEDGRDTTVAVLDTGIEKQHPAFAGMAFDKTNLMDFIADEEGAPGSALDQNGHGTHVAATIFGRDVNGTRIGVARGVDKVLIGKVVGPKGAPTEAVYNGIEWALKRRADVICMSLGFNFAAEVTRLINEGFPSDIAASRTLEAYRSNVRLFDRVAALVDARVARGRGALLVAAAGNASRRNEDPRFTVAVTPPAAADGFFSVGAIGRSGQVATFSNTGCSVTAPGESILSAWLGGGLMTKSGTSMAAPHVAGVMALWTQRLFPGGKRPNGWAKDVQRKVEDSVKPLAGQSRNDIGLGLVQAPAPNPRA